MIVHKSDETVPGNDNPEFAFRQDGVPDLLAG
jgi:hypothetical protein